MNEQETSGTSREALLLVFEEKIDNLLEAVREIKDSINNTSEQVAAMKIDIVTLQNKAEQQEKEINKLNEKNLRTQGWVMGIGATVVASIVVAVLKSVFGI